MYACDIMKNMKETKWSEEKNQILQLMRGLSFEMALDASEKEELEILNTIEDTKSVFKSGDKEKYAQFAKYTKSLHKKKPVTIRFNIADLAAIKAKAKELNINYQNIIQALVHNFAIGKIKLDL